MDKDEITIAFNCLDEVLSECKFLLDLHNKGLNQVDGNFADYQTLAEGGIALNKLKAKFLPREPTEQEWGIERQRVNALYAANRKFKPTGRR